MYTDGPVPLEGIPRWVGFLPHTHLGSLDKHSTETGREVSRMANPEQVIRVIVADLPEVQRIITASAALVLALEPTMPLVVELKEALLALSPSGLPEGEDI